MELKAKEAQEAKVTWKVGEPQQTTTILNSREQTLTDGSWAEAADVHHVVSIHWSLLPCGVEG